MMTQWFECKIQFSKTMEDGLQKKVTETYLVDAMSFTEAERRFLEEISTYVTGEYVITDIKKMKISELFESEDTTDDRWYKARVAFITLDEKSGKEKRSISNMIVQASDLRKALKNLDTAMGTSMQDYVLVSMAETNIMDIFHYKVEGEE